MLKNDKKIRNEMIKKEDQTIKYLIKNDFDVLKGFREFLFELNKSLIFKVSRKHESDGLNWRMNLFIKMRDERMILNQTESMWLRKILIRKYIAAFGLEDIRYLELDDAIEEILDFSYSMTNLISNL